MEILYFKDGVDEFVAKLLESYDGKKFKSVSEADFSLDGEQEKETLKQANEENKELLEQIKLALEGKVKDVTLTSNLKSYPACLISSGELSIEMEKVLNSMPNSENKVVAEKILQISLEHPLLEKLKQVCKTDSEKLKKYAVVLYESARLLEGLSLDDNARFVTDLIDII